MTGRRWVLGLGMVALAGCAAPRMGGGPQGGMGPAPDGTRFINPGTPSGIDGFTHAVKVGFTTYVGGEVGLDSVGRIAGPDLATQARQAFANLTWTLHIAGAEPSDVVRLTVYVVNLKPGDVAVIRQAGAAYFPQRNPPTGLILGVQGLPLDGLLVAVDAEAQTRSLFRARN
jgi:enamine deaminase RidA (YjgF/YER057c/UK114 family)